MEQLRRDIVSAMAETMNVPPKWVRPLFVEDMLGDPTEPADGAPTIFAVLETSMLHGKTGADEKAHEITGVLAKVIWETFGGRFEVEVFIGDLNPEWKTLLDARSDYPERLLAG